MQLTNIEHTSGDTFVRVVQFNNSAGAAIDLTGSVIKMTVKYDSEDDDYIAQVTAVKTVPETS